VERIALLLLAKGANWGVTRVDRPGVQTQGGSIVKIVIMTTAAFFA
jgi:hypothetical protein